MAAHRCKNSRALERAHQFLSKECEAVWRKNIFGWQKHDADEGWPHARLLVQLGKKEKVFKWALI